MISEESYDWRNYAKNYVLKSKEYITFFKYIQIENSYFK